MYMSELYSKTNTCIYLKCLKLLSHLHTYILHMFSNLCVIPVLQSKMYNYKKGEPLYLYNFFYIVQFVYIISYYVLLAD